MFALPRLTARLAVVASFAALLAAACNTDSNGPSSPTLSARAVSFNSSKGNSSSFTVLANAAVTCTNATISGDVGILSPVPPGSSVTQTNCTINGNIHAGDGVAKQAFNNFLSTYAALAVTQCTQTFTRDAFTDEALSLTPGVYCFPAAVTFTRTTLTLNGPANGTWLFKIGTGGTGALTGTDFSVVMAGGGDPCNVTWWVAQAATITRGAFQGNILAGAAITLTGIAGTGGTFNGNAWAGASGVGDVTITDMTVTGCAGTSGNGKAKCNQGVGNGPEGCDPGNSKNHNPSNDETGGTPGNPGRKGGK